MKEWLSEAVACYQFHISYALGDGKILWIFLACIALLLIWQKKEEGHRRLAGWFAVAAILILNPFFVPALNAASAGDYWRILWVLGMPVVIAFAFTIVIFKAKKNVIRILLGGMLAASIFFIGVFSYNGVNFQASENLYKLPEDVIEVCELTHEKEGPVKLAAPDDLNSMIRQYDATILLVYGRFSSANQKLGELMNPEEFYDLDAIAKRAAKKNCNRVVLRSDKIPEEKKGGTKRLQLLGQTDSGNYCVYAIGQEEA